MTGHSRSPRNGRIGSADPSAAGRGAPIHRGKVLLQLHLGALQLAGELGRQLAAAIDVGDELRARSAARSAAIRAAAAACFSLAISPGVLRARCTPSEADDILPLLFGAMAIDGGDGRHHRYARPTSFRSETLKSMRTYRRRPACRARPCALPESGARFGRLFELGNLVARVAELDADLLRFCLDVLELLGSEIALDFEAS